MTALTVLTGASSNHFDCLRNLLRSLELCGWSTPVVVHDLGLTADEVGRLRDEGREVRRFPFEQHPPHVDIRVGRGAYAWKPIIIADALAERRGPVLWLDAGNLVYRPPDRIAGLIRAHGIYTPHSLGVIGRWTHPDTLRRLAVAPRLQRRRNRNAAVVGLDGGRAAVRALAQEWKACALDPACIAPAGASLANHRYDQAILSILYQRYAAAQRVSPRSRVLDVATHNDHVTAAEVPARLAELRRRADRPLRRLAALLLR